MFSAAEGLYREALGLLTDSKPEALHGAWSHLGHLLLRLGEPRAEEAYQALTEAIRYTERLRAETLTLSLRESVMRENVATYDALLVAAVRVGRIKDALVAAEHGKSRALADLLSLRDLQPRNMPTELVQEYRQLLIRMRSRAEETDLGDGSIAEARLDPHRQGNPADSQTNALRLRELIQTMRESDPELLTTAEPLSEGEILALAATSHSILALFRVTDWGSFVFLVFPDGAVEMVTVPQFTRGRLTELLSGSAEKRGAGWLGRYEATVADEASVGASAEWHAEIDEILGSLDKELLAPVRERLSGWEASVTEEFPGCRPSLVLIPNRGLALLPLHACWRKETEGRRYLLDEYTIRYSPSLAVFQRCVKQDAVVANVMNVMAFANPVPPGDLTFAEWECEQICQAWGSSRSQILAGEAATLGVVEQAAREASIVHFACHGRYQPDNPLNSRLEMAGEQPLLLRNVLGNLRLPVAWLVALSACETGMVDPKEMADEHYGLPIGFLNAGAPTVYFSLWAVNDLTSALLMARVHARLAQGTSKATALQDAQIWLRDVTLRELESFTAGSAMPAMMAKVERLSELHEPQSRPFAHPVWWAAFQTVGV